MKEMCTRASALTRLALARETRDHGDERNHHAHDGLAAQKARGHHDAGIVMAELRVCSAVVLAQTVVGKLCQRTNRCGKLEVERQVHAKAQHHCR